MSVSQLLGKTKTYPFDFNCKSGTYITQFDGTRNQWMYTMGATCSDGGKLGPVGKLGTTPYSVRSTNGFSGWNSAYKGDATDGIIFLSGNGTVLPLIGGTGGGAVPKWTCPSGSKISGFGGSHGPYGISTRFTCSAPVQPIDITPYTTPISTLPYEHTKIVSTTPTTFTTGTYTTPTTTYITPTTTSMPQNTGSNTTPLSNTIPLTNTTPTTDTSKQTTEPEKPKTEEAKKPEPEPEPEKSKTWIWILIFVIIIVLAIVGAVVAYFLLKHKKETS